MYIPATIAWALATAARPAGVTDDDPGPTVATGQRRSASPAFSSLSTVDHHRRLVQCGQLGQPDLGRLALDRVREHTELPWADPDAGQRAAISAVRAKPAWFTRNIRSTSTGETAAASARPDAFVVAAVTVGMTSTIGEMICERDHPVTDRILRERSVQRTADWVDSRSSSACLMLGRVPKRAGNRPPGTVAGRADQ